jgi:intracellular septation protein A
MQNNQKSPFTEILINIVFPTLILNKGAKYLGTDGATKALVIALAFPLLYAIYDFIKFRKPNFISILGFVSLLLTGGFGLLKFEGHWFAIKEAAFPLVIGLVVLASSYTKSPLMNKFILNESLVHKEKIDDALEQRGSRRDFQKHLKKSTIYFSFSFFFSALLNYILAIRIFTKIPLDLPEAQRSEILNAQIAEMTWLGYVVILIPSLLIMGIILWHLFKGIKEYTGYQFTEILKDQKSSS